MAAKETIRSQQSGIESIVNRWVVDYYLFLALEAYKDGQAAVFCGTRRILNSVLDRPYESTDTLPTKIGILHFLSRIYDGERLDYFFESDHSITPLESALTLLEGLAKKCSVSQEDVAIACSSIKEMMVRVLIKNDEFDKAKELLNKHFPKPMVGKKAIYMGLISNKSKRHELIEQIDFQQFKDEMLAFCQKFCSFNVPFLHKAATQLIDKRLIEQSDVATGSDEQDESGVTNPQMISFVPCKHTVIPRSRLEEVYKALAAGSKGRTFSQLEEEVEREEQARTKHLCLHLSPTPEKSPEHNGLFQRESGSPMEASPAEQTRRTHTVPDAQAGSLSKTHSVPKKRRLYTVAQLVVEPDSQTSLQSSMLSQGQEAELGAEELPQSPAVSDEDSQSLYLTDSEIAVPSRRLRRRSSKRCSRASPSSSSNSEGGPSSPVDIRKTNVGKSQTQLNSSLTRKFHNSRQFSSDSDEDPQDSPGTPRTPARKRTASHRLTDDPESEDGICVLDSSLDTSPQLSSPRPVPQTSSTPHRDSPQDKSLARLKWKQLYRNALESKERWSDEESYFGDRKTSGLHNTSMSTANPKRKKWTNSETKKLVEGVKKFGEGNWGKIKSYYNFEDRTNVNLKDRWRTLKKTNAV